MGLRCPPSPVSEVVVTAVAWPKLPSRSSLLMTPIAARPAAQRVSLHERQTIIKNSDFANTRPEAANSKADIPGHYRRGNVVDQYVIIANIRNFLSLLEKEKDEDRRGRLKNFLLEEEQKLASLAQQDQASASQGNAFHSQNSTTADASAVTAPSKRLGD